MSKSEDMRRLIDLANNKKIISESHSDDASPFKAFSSWSKVSEAGMPSSVIKSKEKIRYATDEENKQRFAGKTLEELRSMAWRHGYGKGSKEYDKFHDGVTGVPVTEDAAWNLSESEELSEDVGGDYLYHSTQDADTAKKILSSGVFKAMFSNTGQAVTQAQTKLPVVSFGRNLKYQMSGSHVDRDYQVVFVINRKALETRYKTLGTSQSQTTRGLANPVDTEYQTKMKKLGKAWGVDTNNDGEVDYNEIKNVSKSNASDTVKKVAAQSLNAPKSGGEFEEVVPTKTGQIPWKGMLVGFYLVPGKAAAQDQELLNHPLRLDMPRPNTFVKHQEKAGVTEEGVNEDVAPLSIEQLATISDEALDNAYHYGRSSAGNTFGWQANLKSAEFAKKMIDKGVTDIEQISDAIHRGWNITAHAFVQNPNQFDDTEKLKASGKLEAKLEQRGKLMNINYAQLPDDEKEKDRVVARALLQALTGDDQVNEDLHKWFKEKWVRFGPDGKIRGDCARGDDSEGKPKCLPQSKAHNLGKKARASAASRKRRKDPNAERSGKAINVNTKKKKSNESLEHCPHCDGPMYHESMMNEKQDACYHKVKSRYKVWPSAYACVPEKTSKALTREGWKAVGELHIGEEILTYSMERDELEFKPILNLHRYQDVPTKIVKSGNTGFMFESTENHKWVVKLPNVKSNRESKYEKINNMALIETREMLEVKNQKHLVVTAPYNGGTPQSQDLIFKYGTNWVKYILNITPEQRQSWLFSAIVYDGNQVKTQRLTEKDENISDLAWEYSGNHGKQAFGFKQKDVEHRDAFLLSAFLNGGTVTWKKHSTKNIYSCYYVSNKRYKNLWNFQIVGENNTSVWCPETENKTWVMQQETENGGIISITGNSGALVQCRKKGAKNWGNKK